MHILVLHVPQRQADTVTENPHRSKARATEAENIPRWVGCVVCSREGNLGSVDRVWEV